MFNSKSLSILIVVSIACANAFNENVNIYNMTVQNYHDIENNTDLIWLIELTENSFPSEDFEKTAKIFNGIANAGFINCFNENCNSIQRQEKVKIVFYYNNILVNDFLSPKPIEIAIKDIISNKFKIQMKQINN